MADLTASYSEDQFTTARSIANVPDADAFPVRENFDFKIERNGIDIRNEQYDTFIRSIFIEQGTNSIDLLKLQFANFEHVFVNDKFFRTGSEFTVWLGYRTTSMRYHGRYIVSKPKFRFEETSDIELECFSPMLKMTQHEKRRNFVNMLDSEIVQRIANEYVFESDIDLTPIRYTQVTQANINDFKFIYGLAERNGYLFYYENDTFNFHKKRKIELDLVINFLRGGGVQSAEIEVIGDGKFSRFTITGVDPLSGLVQVTSGFYEPDNATDREGDVLSVRDFANEKQRFLVAPGQLRNKNEFYRIAAAALSASRYSVRIICTTFGIEELRPNRIIAIRGLGRFSGRYYISRVQHRWDVDSGYYTCFEGYRTFTGLFEAFTESPTGSPEDVTLETVPSERANTAVMTNG